MSNCLNIFIQVDGGGDLIEKIGERWTTWKSMIAAFYWQVEDEFWKLPFFLQTILK